MTIGEVITSHPELVEVFMEEGVHCVGCGAATFETIEQGLMGHGKSEKDVDDFVESLNDVIVPEKKNDDLIISDKAINKVKTLVEKDTQGLRIKVVDGGCSGQKYVYQLDEKADKDEVIEKNGVKFIVDETSMAKLKGSKLDYDDGLSNAGFKIVNPNAKATCGCGVSFN